jgi:hypothetical protein
MIPSWDGPHCFTIEAPPMTWVEPFMQDFDQHQQDWDNFCGPTAAVNWIWWFDLQYSDWDLIPPVFDYVAWPLIGYMSVYMNTNSETPGTSTTNFQNGMRQFIDERGLAGRFIDTTYYQPSFEFCRNELLRGQSVILQLGFWECTLYYPVNDTCVEVTYERNSGHYVTMTGTDSVGYRIGISDPGRDAAETILPNPPSRVIGTDHNHPLDHNWGTSASHDVYRAIVPGFHSFVSRWDLNGYWSTNNMDDYSESNQGQVTLSVGFVICDSLADLPQLGLVHTAVEAAYIIGPRGGDANSDGAVNVGDPVFLINYIFKGGTEPENPEECDPNCDDNVNVGDVVYLVNHIFKGGAAPCGI